MDVVVFVFGFVGTIVRKWACLMKLYVISLEFFSNIRWGKAQR